LYGGFPETDLNRYQKNWSPLHIAAAQGHLEFCKYISLIIQGCPDRPNHESYRQLYFTDLVQNSLRFNMGIYFFLPPTSWRLLEAKNTPQRPKMA
jgi:hypothetical protein